MLSKWLVELPISGIIGCFSQDRQILEVIVYVIIAQFGAENFFGQRQARNGL
jgi:hypothetical protein